MHFKNNQINYQWKKRFEVDIFSSTNKLIIEKAQQFLNKGKSLDFIKEKLNKDGKVNVMVKSGLFEEDYDILSYYPNASKGVTSIVLKDNYFFRIAYLWSPKSRIPGSVKYESLFIYSF